MNGMCTNVTSPPHCGTRFTQLLILARMKNNACSRLNHLGKWEALYSGWRCHRPCAHDFRTCHSIDLEHTLLAINLHISQNLLEPQISFSS